VEVVCKADEEGVKILFKEQDAAQYCRQAKVRYLFIYICQQLL
jgi:hypothetical protein